MISLSPQSERRRQLATGTLDHVSGARPRVYPAGRKCQCGSPLSIYNRGPLCNPCRETKGPRPAPQPPLLQRKTAEQRAADILSRFVENTGLVHD